MDLNKLKGLHNKDFDVSRKTAIRCITRDATIALIVMDSTDIASEAERIHQTSAVASAALGRTLTAASLMGVQLKGADDSVTLKIKGGGPLGAILAVSDSNGNVRGYVANPVVEIPLKSNGKLDVSTAVGLPGSLHVIRDTGGAMPYSGVVELTSGEIAEDVTYYYAASEQIPTVCSLGVLVDVDLTIKSSGGFLLQLLPFCPDEIISQVEKNISKVESMTSMLESGMSIAEVADLVLDGFEWEILDAFNPKYECKCSKERVEKVLVALSKDDIDKLFDEDNKIIITCQFCDKVYNFTKDATDDIINR